MIINTYYVQCTKKSIIKISKDREYDILMPMNPPFTTCQYEPLGQKWDFVNLHCYSFFALARMWLHL